MRPTFPVQLSTEGMFDVSTIVDDIGTFETRFFRTVHKSYGGDEIPGKIKGAVVSEDWEKRVDGWHFVEYDHEAVQTSTRTDALRVHNTFVRILLDYNSGVLA